MDTISTACVFGESTARGIVFDPTRQRLTRVKEDVAAGIAREFGIRVDNFAVIGCTISRGVAEARKRADILPEYGFAALCFGGNDCNFNWREIAEAPDAAHLPATPIGAFVREYAALLSLLQGAGVTPIVFTPPPISARKFFDTVTRGLDAPRVLRYLGDVAQISRWHSLYAEMARDAAKDAGARLVDIHAALRARDDADELVCADGMHPSEAGYAVIGEIVRAELGELLRTAE